MILKTCTAPLITGEIILKRTSQFSGEIAFIQAWAQSTCPELSAQGLVPLRWYKLRARASGTREQVLKNQNLAPKTKCKELIL